MYNGFGRKRLWESRIGPKSQFLLVSQNLFIGADEASASQDKDEVKPIIHIISSILYCHCSPVAMSQICREQNSKKGVVNESIV